MTKSDIRRLVVKSKEELQSTSYNVDPTKVVRIRDSSLLALKNWIKNWRSKTGLKGSKPILLITGQPGTGKSWFAYRLISELMGMQYNILIIAKTLDTYKQLLFSNELTVDDVQGREKNVFIFDDAGIKVGVDLNPLMQRKSMI